MIVLKERAEQEEKQQKELRRRLKQQEKLQKREAYEAMERQKRVMAEEIGRAHVWTPVHANISYAVFCLKKKKHKKKK